MIRWTATTLAVMAACAVVRSLSSLAIAQPADPRATTVPRSVTIHHENESDRNPQATSAAPPAAAAAASEANAASQVIYHDEPAKFLIIDRDLREDVVEIRRITPTTVECIRESLPDNRPIADLLGAVRLGDDVETPDPRANRLEMIDGQVWMGSPMPTSSKADLAWKIDFLGRFVTQVDHVRRARFKADAPFPKMDETVDSDRLLLANNDHLEGFIDTMNNGIDVETSSGGRLHFEYTQVAALSMVNPMQKTFAGQQVWLGDGTVMDVQSCAWSPSGMTLSIAGIEKPVGVDSSLFRGICFDARAFVPLARLSFTARGISDWLVSFDEPRILDPDRALGLSDIRLQGPVEAQWEIPEGAVRFVATAVVPREYSRWADFILVITDGAGRELLRTEMDGAGNSRKAIDLTLPAKDAAQVPLGPAGGGRGNFLVVRLEQGSHGPVQDIVVLQRPLMLVALPTDSRQPRE